MAADFYARLPALTQFSQLVEDDVYTPLPDDWTVVLTDVIGSTQAVQAGRYRDVNYVGAASIAAVLNASDRADLPFVFGGDGATLVVPPEHLRPALRALSALQNHSSDRLDLALRVGAVSLADVRAAGREIAVARYQAAPEYAQALFRGTGMAWVEDQLKSPETAARYASHAEPTESEDPYAGLECRWQDVRSPRGETVSLLIEAIGDDRTTTYREVLDAVEQTYGKGDEARPVAIDRILLSLSPAKLGPEVRLRHPEAPLRSRLKLWALNIVGRFLIRFGLETSETDWDEYPRLFAATTDYRKFDGVLRMVLAGGPDERRRLEERLETAYQEGRLAYGLHVSDRAVLTCLVYKRMGQQVHFVDGAGGGYTNAAVGFKRRLKALRSGEVPAPTA